MSDFYFAVKPELRTSYANQRGLALRDLGPEVKCIHEVSLSNSCGICRTSGECLVRTDAVRSRAQKSVK
ncbi:MAG TPA: hypothetical protein PLB92_00260 [Rhodoglobus sp.]|nr:hypothetical protein [Rhodoglobus sp.]